VTLDLETSRHRLNRKRRRNPSLSQAKLCRAPTEEQGSLAKWSKNISCCRHLPEKNSSFLGLGGQTASEEL